MKKLLYLFLTSLLMWTCQKEVPLSSDTLFTQIPASKSGIDFTNQVEDKEDFNILNYRNFYNGGGVAIGDINNDQLPDIYFTANMEANRLYLNKGGFQFEDITEVAGVAGTKAWSTGVTMVDINADGLLDIYVCNSGDIKGDNKENELFINQGNNTFVEEAAKWGLNNQGFSTHASFFDYDRDGDLDCYLLNNSFRSPDRIEFYGKKRDEVHAEGGDKLLRNEGDRFVDVTQEAGIYTSDIGFGLGVSISDINGDMWPDVYVSNDFWERDYLYINQGNGTFSEELSDRTDICSLSSMGADIADLNNDGAPEVITTDMLPPDNKRIKTMTQFSPFYLQNFKAEATYHHQILQNCLHLNDGTGHFQEMANFAGTAASDWSWGALSFDFDNNGLKDIFISNGIIKDLTDFDFVDFIMDKEAVRKTVEETKRADFRDFLPAMPSTKIENAAFVNNGDLTFTNLSTSLGLATPSFSNGAAYGDLDDDGDLDLVVNNNNMEAFLYRNNSDQQYLKIELQGPPTNPLGVGAKVQIKSGNRIQELQHFPTRGFESSCEPGLIFGLGETTEVDELTVIWPDLSTQRWTKVGSQQKILAKYAEAKEKYQVQSNTSKTLFADLSNNLFIGNTKHQENRFNDFDQERLLPKLLSTEGPKIVKGNINQDNLEDFVVLGASGDEDKVFIQQANGTFRRMPQSAIAKDKDAESSCGILYDVDADGDQDLIIGIGGNEYGKGFQSFSNRMYINDGRGQFSRGLEQIPPIIGFVSCMEKNDINADGRDDLFIGGRAVPGNYGLNPRSFVLEKLPFDWADITNEESGNLGMVTDAKWVDFANDEQSELVVVGEWLPIVFLKKVDKELKVVETIPNSSGWWNTVEAADLNGDGRQDLILGNWGDNSKLKAKPTQPLNLYINDFDQNKKSDIVMTWYPPGETKAFPFASKMDMTAQMPGLKKKFLKYSDYAEASYEDMFPEADRARSLKKEAQYLKSAILWNEEDGFRLEALPWQAQLSPIYSIVAEDLDGDEKVDLFLGGNFYGLKPEIGRLDGNHGTFLKGDGKGNFTYLSPEESGLKIKGEVRDATTINTRNGKVLIVARNNETLLAYKLQTQ